jgi:AbrB family looped-hinge helix DNA binding protein
MRVYMTVVSISPRYRITIPKEIRDETNLKVGDKISFLRKGDEIIIFKVPEKPLLKMAGSLKTKKNIRKILQELKQEEIEAEKYRVS